MKVNPKARIVAVAAAFVAAGAVGGVVASKTLSESPQRDDVLTSLASVKESCSGDENLYDLREGREDTYMAALNACKDNWVGENFGVVLSSMPVSDWDRQCVENAGWRFDPDLGGETPKPIESSGYEYVLREGEIAHCALPMPEAEQCEKLRSVMPDGSMVLSSRDAIILTRLGCTNLESRAPGPR